MKTDNINLNELLELVNKTRIDREKLKINDKKMIQFLDSVQEYISGEYADSIGQTDRKIWDKKRLVLDREIHTSGITLELSINDIEHFRNNQKAKFMQSIAPNPEPSQSRFSVDTEGSFVEVEKPEGSSVDTEDSFVEVEKPKTSPYKSSIPQKLGRGSSDYEKLL